MQIDAATTTDFIWIYYNSLGAMDAQDAQGVWDINYRPTGPGAKVTMPSSPSSISRSSPRPYPLFDPLRDDPRFHDLLLRMNLEP